ncbi:MAG TPA: carboxypeptidase-like regulatory domain-containing protein [Bryobacteraceae bacterium]|nr:carboxypeptidase-like regulatory domain-containing protein [Bryobacteraceae bacterium]
MTSVLVLALILAQQANPPEKATVSGTVVDSITGQPLDKVRIIAEHHNSHDPGASTTTDSKGEFTLIDLDPGEYRLSAKRSGYLETYYGAKDAFDYDGSPIVLTTDQSVDSLRMKMTPFGVIAGTVRDSDGEPFAGAAVDLFVIRHQNGRRVITLDDNSHNTDDLGQFRFAGLRPGRYYIAASASRHGEQVATIDHSPKSVPHPDPAVPTFYPGTTDPSNATAIDLAPAGRQTGVDITLLHSRLHKLIVHIQAAAGQRVNGRLTYAEEQFGQVGDSNTDKETVVVTSVPSGSYVFRFGASEPGKQTPGVLDFTESSNGCDASMPVVIDKDDTVEMTATAPACAQITGHVITDNGKPLKEPGGWGYTFVLDNKDNGHFYLKADGSFRMTVAPGNHTLDFSDIRDENNLYIKSIRSGNQDLLRSGLTVNGGDHLDLEVVLGSDGGRVDGAVSDADGKPVPAAMVVLIPNDPALRSRLDYTPSTTTTQAGHYEIKAIAPGDYKLFAFDDIEKESWLDPDVLRDFESRGTPVTVKPGDPNAKDTPAQTVDLKLIQ